MMADILKFTDTQLLTKASKSKSITNTNLLLAPVLVTVVMSELVLNRKTYLHILARATWYLRAVLTKADHTLYSINADEVAVTNNAIMHLFNRIEYHLSNQLIESINDPG